jgi:hypothetical protein
VLVWKDLNWLEHCLFFQTERAGFVKHIRTAVVPASFGTNVQAKSMVSL